MTRVLGIKALMEKIPSAEARDEFATLVKDMGDLISRNILENLSNKEGREQIALIRKNLAKRYNEFLQIFDQRQELLPLDDEVGLRFEMRELVFEYLGLKVA